MKNTFKKIAAAIFVLLSLFSLMLVVAAIGDISAGDPKGTGMGVLTGLCVFFGGSTALFAWLAYVLGLRKNPQSKIELEQQVLKLAKANQGKLTTALLAADTDLSIEQSQQLLEHFVEQNVATMETQEGGALCFIFAGLGTGHLEFDT